MRRRRLTTANAAIRAARRAWSIGIRAGWVSKNPFSKPELEQTGGETRAATREEVECFIAKADEMGRPSMSLAAMLAFELCQRESDVVETIGWNRYKEGQEIQVKQHKTGQWIGVPLLDEEGELFPGLVARLTATPRRGPLIVMRDSMDRRIKQYLPYKEDNSAGRGRPQHFQALPHQAYRRRRASLPLGGKASADQNGRRRGL